MADTAAAAQTLTSMPLAADRDVRFQRMLRRQLGENGVFLMSVYTFLSLLAIVIVSVLAVGYASVVDNDRKSRTVVVGPGAPALL